MLIPDFSAFNNPNILVIGDIMLDHYIYGDCNRISPEAPVPVVEVRSENYTLGGAGNVVKNLHAFECVVDIVSLVGVDEDAKIILSELAQYGISGNGLIKDYSRCTTLKTRVLAVNHQLIRLDREINKPITAEIEAQVLAIVESKIKRHNVLLLSDYNKGLLTPGLLRDIFAICNKNGVVTIVDPKGLDFEKYKGATIIKPNKKEAVVATGIAITDKESLKAACVKIQQITLCKAVVITMSEEGIALYNDDELDIIPTKAIGVIDVTGAGDTVLASLGVSLASNLTLRQACGFANAAAAIVVSKAGSATATLKDVNEKMFL